MPRIRIHRLVGGPYPPPRNVNQSTAGRSVAGLAAQPALTLLYNESDKLYNRGDEFPYRGRQEYLTNNFVGGDQARIEHDCLLRGT